MVNVHQLHLLIPTLLTFTNFTHYHAPKALSTNSIESIVFGRRCNHGNDGCPWNTAPGVGCSITAVGLSLFSLVRRDNHGGIGCADTMRPPLREKGGRVGCMACSWLRRRWPHSDVVA